MNKIISAALVLCLLFPTQAFPQQPIQLMTIEDESSPAFHWTEEVRRQYTYYELMNRKPYSDLIVKATVSDPYFNSSNSWNQGYKDLWALKKINVEQAWSASKGSGVLVAVLDTGIDFNHPDINDNIWLNLAEFNGTAGVDDDNNGYIDDVRGWDFVGASSITPVEDNNTLDNSGHGTHVAGIIAAEEDGNGIIGVAPKVKILPVKVLDDGGSGFLDALAKGIRYAVDMGAKVINMSLVAATSFMPAPLREAIDYAYSLGCVLVVAAGNSNADVSGYVPANSEKVLTVSAVDYSDAKASTSNFGSDVDVAAPGVGILSLRASGTDMYAGSTGYTPGDNFVPALNSEALYYWANGTSMAAGYVSGLAALIFADNPTLSSDEVMNKIRFSATDLGTAGFDTQFGYGVINAYKALTTSYDNIFDLFNYYRTKLGDTSTNYKTPANAIIRNEVTGIKRIGSIDTMILRSFETPEQAKYVTLDSSGLKIYGLFTDFDLNGASEDVIFNSPLDILPRYLEEGKTYNDQTTFSFMGIDYNFSSAVTVWGAEDVTLDSGVFFSGALKFSINISIDSITEGYSEHISQIKTDWAVKSLGDVKTIVVSSGYGTDTYNIRTATNYHESGKMKSKLLQSPDPDFIYYEYIDEDFNDTGIGRISRKQKVDGSYKILTYWGDTAAVKSSASYNPSGAFLSTDEYNSSGNLIKKTLNNGEVYTYYASGKLESKALPSADSSGNIYYHYIDEDWANQGFGRIDKKTMGTPDGNGARSIVYTYFSVDVAPRLYKSYSSRSQVQYEDRYRNTDFTGLSSRTEYKTESAHSVNPLGYFSTSGGGFIMDFGSKGLRKYENGTWSQISSWDPDSVWQINGTDLLIDFGPGHGLYKYINQTLTNISSEDPIKLIPLGSTADYKVLVYFPSSGLSYLTPGGIAQISSLYPEYLFSANGDCVSFGSDGIWKITNGVMAKISDKSLDPGTGGDPALYMFDSNFNEYVLLDLGNDGLWSLKNGVFTQVSNLNPVYMDYLSGGARTAIVDFGVTGGIWKYSNESLTKLIDRGGVRFVLPVGSGTDDLIIDYGSDGIWKYSGGNLTKLSAFGGAQSWSGSSGAITVDLGDRGLWMYKNNSWSILSPYDLESKYGYDPVYYDFGTHGLWKYSNGTLTQISEWDACTIYTVNNDGPLVDFGARGIQQYKNGSWFEVSPDSPLLSNGPTSQGYMLEKKVYYASGRLESKANSIMDDAGSLYYHYLDEDWASQGYGRVDKLVFSAADSDGAKAYTYEYFTGTNKVSKKYLYASADRTDPANPVLSGQIALYEYNASGQLIKKTLSNGEVYTYYASGRLESKTLPSADSSGNIYYHYLDEDWGNRGYGRADKLLRGLPDADGAIAISYEYFTSRSEIKYERRYGDTSFTTLMSLADYDSAYLISNAPWPYSFMIDNNQNNFIMDFGDKGLQKYVDGVWSQISPWDPVSISYYTGSKMLIDFGPDHGIWAYSNNSISPFYSESPLVEIPGSSSLYYFKSSGLSLLTDSGVTQVSALCPDGYLFSTYINNVVTEYYSFGSNGMWKFSNGQMTKVFDKSPVPNPVTYSSSYSALDLFDSNRNPYFLLDLDRDGLWKYYNGTFTKISSLDPAYMGYFPGDYRSALIDFGVDGGIWKCDNSGLIKIIDRGGIKATLVSKSGGIILDYGSDGIWEYSDGNVTKIFDLGGADYIGYLGSSDPNYYALAADFGTRGLWIYQDSVWNKVSSYDLYIGMTDSEGAFYWGFESNGLWKYSNGSMLQISSWDPSDLYSVNDDGPLVDFGAHGLLQYKNGSWIEISPDSPFLSNNSNFNTGTLYRKSLYYSSGKLESKAYAIPDDAGNIYYHYLDEDWASQGYGRVDKLVLAAADSDGAKAYTYEYFAGTSEVSMKMAYRNVDFTDLLRTYDYGTGDLYADFGTGGFWKYSNNAWDKLSTNNIRSFVVSETNNGKHDMIGDFGSVGLWKYASTGEWTQLSANPITSYKLSDTYNGNYDTIGDFGSVGLWKYASTGEWTQISSNSTQSFLISGLYNGNYDTIGDFGSVGLWKYTSAGAWTQLSTNPVESYMLSDIYNGNYDMIGDFGSVGLWKYASTGQWTQLSQNNAQSFQLSGLYNNDNYDMIGDFGSIGMWKYASTGQWTQLSTNHAESFLLSDTSNGGYDMIGDFGSVGLWKYASTGQWTRLSQNNARSFALSGLYNGGYDVIGDFGSAGLWKYASTGQWTLLSPNSPNSFLLSARGSNGNYDIIGDFGASGLWQHSTSSSQWTQLSVTPIDPELLQRLDIQNSTRTYGKAAEGGFTFTGALAKEPTKPKP